MPLFRGFFDWKQNTGRIRSAFVDASVDRDMRFLSCFTVKSFPGVTVREHEILGSGSDRYTHTMSRKKGIGQFGRPDRYLIDFVRFQIFRMFKTIAVFCPDHSIGQNIRPFFFLCVIFRYFQLISDFFVSFALAYSV